MGQPLVAVLPHEWSVAEDAIRAAGGLVVGLDEAEGLVWFDWEGPAPLAAVLADAPQIRWVHLPGAGVEKFIDAGLTSDGRTWTCGKGAHSAMIAEHALALALAGLRGVVPSARRTSWARQPVAPLQDRPVTIIGGGGIAAALIGLLAPFGSPVTVVRRRADPVAGAARTVTTDQLHRALGDARVVVLALALTPETHHIIGADELDRMHDHAWLVNVSRGGHVDTDALVDALRNGAIAGAALDVTDPEPLPDGHPLWTMPNCVITPHLAGASGAVMEILAARVGDNVQRLGAGEPLVGLVDPIAGY